MRPKPLIATLTAMLNQLPFHVGLWGGPNLAGDYLDSLPLTP
jgi:hypothetical protein